MEDKNNDNNPRISQSCEGAIKNSTSHKHNEDNHTPVLPVCKTLEAIRNALSPTAETEYYSKYTEELVLPFDDCEALNNTEAIKELHKAIDQIYKAQYGRYRSLHLSQDFYAVLERKDKQGNTTHPHWHVLMTEQTSMSTGLVQKIWKHGEAWVRDKETNPMFNAHNYIIEYLHKDENAYHYLGE